MRKDKKKTPARNEQASWREEKMNFFIFLLLINNYASMKKICNISK